MTACGCGQDHLRTFRRRSVQYRDVADTAHQHRLAVVHQRLHGCITRHAVTDPHADLDEFVVVERLDKFGEHGRRHPGLADVYARLEVVRSAAQEASLHLGQFHGDAL